MLIDGFCEYLKKERRMAKNTLEAYKRDVMEFAAYEKSRDIGDLREVPGTEVVAFLLQLKNNGKSAATVNRKLASVRAFYNYLMENNQVTSNPTQNIKSPRIERKAIEYLTIEEVDKLLGVPDDSIIGLRDRAMLELLYATGIRVTELIEADLEDLNLRMGFITCAGEQSKARIIPVGRPARAALESYIYDARSALVKEKTDQTALFVNYNGERLTRQGMWKILKEYGRKLEMEEKLTPNVLRNSFAVHMIQNGADLKSLQELMGHEDISATQIYLTVTKSRIKDVYDRTHPRA